MWICSTLRRYHRIDVTATMAGSASFWKATQYLMGNHTIAERMFRHDPSVMLHGGVVPQQLAVRESAGHKCITDTTN